MIDDKDDPCIRSIQRLFQRDERDKRGLYLADGIRFVAQALEAGARIDTLLYAPKVLTSAFGRKLVQQACGRGAACLETTPDIYYRLSQSREPQGILAVISGKCERLAKVVSIDNCLWVGLEEVQSPGNFGTIVRSCAAAGACGVILLGDKIDPFDTAAVRATMGALFFQKVVRSNCLELAAWARKHSVAAIGTSPTARQDFRMIDYRGPTLLLMGSERHGLSEAQKAVCNDIVRIPMAGKTDSLNLANATTIMLYEAYRQRNPAAE